MAWESEIIKHLTKEIETQINNMMLFRSRVSLSIYLGPFFILGSYVVAKDGNLVRPDLTCFFWGWLAVLVLCYITLGIIGGLIERHSWLQCNKWRELIVELQSENPPNLKGDQRLTFPEKLRLGYFLVYFLMIFSFLSISVLLFSIGT